MIIDSIKRAFIYEQISPAFVPAMEFLSKNSNGELTKERYEIPTDVCALVMQYSPKALENCKYEAHKNYIDVQYFVSGDEYKDGILRVGLQRKAITKRRTCII